MKKKPIIQNNKVLYFSKKIIFCFLILFFLTISINKIDFFGKTKYNKKDDLLIFKNISSSNYQKNQRTKISLFIPIYNKENYIKNCIQTIQSQTLKDIEIIAVNDHSTDNSLKILTSLAEDDNRIKIINNEKNHGLLYCRALGIMSSLGEYLMNIDADDYLKGCNSLKNLYNKAKRYNIDIIAFSYLKTKTGKIINKFF